MPLLSALHLVTETTLAFTDHGVKCVHIWSYSGLYFPAFGLNTGPVFSPVSLRIQSNAGKCGTE